MSDIEINAAIESNVPITSTAEEPTVEYSDFEKDCIEKGWNPNGKFSAETWSERYELIKTNDKTHKRLKALEASLQDMNEYFKKQAAETEKRHKEEIKKLREEAIYNGDVEAFRKYDSEYEQTIKAQTKVDPAIENFNEKHKHWLKSDAPKHLEMRAYIQRRADAIEAEFPQASMSEKVKLLETSLNKYYADELDAKAEANKSPTAVLPKNSAPISKKTGFSIDKLSYDKRRNYEALKAANEDMAKILYKKLKEDWEKGA